MDSSSVSNHSATHSQAADIDLPRLYRVILLHDGATPASFLCTILRKFFRHDENSASRITLATHCAGRGVAGTYPRDIAEAKAGQVAQAARLSGWPLRCVIEPEERRR